VLLAGRMLPVFARVIIVRKRAGLHDIASRATRDS